jgi:hypothetical protein
VRRNGDKGIKADKSGGYGILLDLDSPEAGRVWMCGFGFLLAVFIPLITVALFVFV